MKPQLFASAALLTLLSAIPGALSAKPLLPKDDKEAVTATADSEHFEAKLPATHTQSQSSLRGAFLAEREEGEDDSDEDEDESWWGNKAKNHWNKAGEHWDNVGKKWEQLGCLWIDNQKECDDEGVCKWENGNCVPKGKPEPPSGNNETPLDEMLTDSEDELDA